MAGVREPGRGEGVELDRFPVGILDFDVLERYAPERRGLFAVCRSVGAFRAELFADPVLPGKPSRVGDEVVRAAVDAGVLRRKRRAEGLRGVVPIWTLPKPSGKARLIADCRPVNCCMTRPPPFTLPSPRELDALLLGGDATRAVVVDFRGFFWQFPLDPGVGEFFSVRQGGGAFAFTRMPMGWSWAPAVAQAAAEAVLGDLRGVSGAAWIDDVVVLGRGVGETLRRRDWFVQRAEGAGAELHPDKGEWEPTSRFLYAGREWDLRARGRRLPLEWRLRVRAEIAAVCGASSVGLRRMWRVVGALVWAFFALGDRLCDVPDLMDWVRTQGSRVAEGLCDWESAVAVPGAVRRDLKWAAAVRLATDVFRAPRPVVGAESLFDAVVYTDASDGGWGWVVQLRAQWGAHRRWGVWGRPEGIFLLEMRAMAWGVAAAVSRGARRILVVGDNAAVTAVLGKGHCALRVGNGVLRRLFDRLDGVGACVFSVWMSTDRMPADELSRRLCRGSDRTPYVTEGVDVRPGGFAWVG